MGNPRIDPHEEMVVNALEHAFSKDVPANCRIILGEKFFHTVPSKKIELDLDFRGVDVIIFLKSGLAVPIQVKAGKQTIGIVLPIPRDIRELPNRLRSRFHNSMYSRIHHHKKLHPEIKAMLFVNDTATPKEIIDELNTIIEISICHLIRDFKKLRADQ